MRRIFIALSVCTLAVAGCSSDSNSEEVERVEAYCGLVQELEEILESDLPDDEKIEEGLTVFGESTQVIPGDLREAAQISFGTAESTEAEFEAAEAEIDEFNQDECGVDSEQLRVTIADLTGG